MSKSGGKRGDRPAAPFASRRGALARTFPQCLVLVIFLVLPMAPASAASGAVSVTATVVSNGLCWFTTNNAALNFGTLDPVNPVDVNASTTVNFRCLGFPSVTYYVDDDDGLYETAPDANRMRNANQPAEYLPYSMDVSPRTATISWNPFILRTLTVSGTVRGADYQDAVPGNYADTVVLTIVP